MVEVELRVESESAGLEGPSYWPLTLHRGLKGLSYIGPKATRERLHSVTLQALHAILMLMFYWCRIKAFLFCFANKAALASGLMAELIWSAKKST